MNILLFDWNSVLTDVKDELIKRGHNLLPIDGKNSTWKKADVIVVWNEIDLGGWREWIKDSRKAGKKVILVQHGRRGTSRIFPPFNEKLESDIVCCWGENDVSRLTSCGVSRDRIKITGTTVFKHLKPRVPHEGINIVFSPEHWDVDVAENFIVKSQLKKLEGVNVIAKLLKDSHDPVNYTNYVISDRNDKGHLDICADVLSKADLVVAISESTFELLAESLDIPVVIADIWIPKACNGDERYRDYHREYSNACLKVKDMSKLNEIIMQTLKHPERLREERKQISILDGGINLDSLKEIIEVIENG